MAASNNTDLPYRDASLPTEQRVSDLLSRLTLPEKAGLLFQDMIMMGPNGTLSPWNPVAGQASTETLVTSKLMSHFNVFGAVQNARDVAVWYNEIQKLALTKTRLGIPVTISTDPRNHFNENLGTSFNAGTFSQWPETLGFAALRDEALVERFADIARQEYISCGMRLALHPQVDLATEPRWCRISLTFGEDADLSSKLGQAYIRGFQGSGSDRKKSVSCMTKHFPGGGPQKDGEDPHFTWGKEQVYPGHNFDYHLKPFLAAIEEGTKWIMPYYGQPIGLDGIEEVGFGLNKNIITDLLRTKLGYDGIVCTDWGLVSDATILGQDMPARAWGCEHLTELERVKKVLDAGCDQFGGESKPEHVVKLVTDNLIPESRLDPSVRKLLTEKFELGLFDHPFIDPDLAAQTVGRDDFKREGELTQRRSYTLLTNKSSILPIRDLSHHKLYVEGIDPTFLTSHNNNPNLNLTLVPTPQLATLALLRLKCPFTPRPAHEGFAAFFHSGSLEFPPDEKLRLREIFNAVPTVVDIYLDRPAVMPEIVEHAAAVLVDYGANEAAFLDVVTGVVGPEGRLPFDLPGSTEAVERGREDVPFDTEGAVFRFGDGLRYG